MNRLEWFVDVMIFENEENLSIFNFPIKNKYWDLIPFTIQPCLDGTNDVSLLLLQRFTGVSGLKIFAPIWIYFKVDNARLLS